METKSERMKRFGRILSIAREDGGKTQEYCSKKLGVSRKTVQHWEAGETAPNMFEVMEWFSACGVSPMVYLLGYLHPYTFKGQSNTLPDENIDDALLKVILSMTMSEKRQLLFILAGQHGSSMHNILNMSCCHLHLPMKSRVLAAGLVFESFNMEKENLICKDNIMPNMEELRTAIMLGKQAALAGERGYSIWQDSKREQMEDTKEN